MSTEHTVITFERGELPQITWAKNRLPNGALRMILNDDLLLTALDKPNADLRLAELDVLNSINKLLS